MYRFGGRSIPVTVKISRNNCCGRELLHGLVLILMGKELGES